MRQRIVAFARFAGLGISDIRKIDNTVASSHLQYDEEGQVVIVLRSHSIRTNLKVLIKYFSLVYPIIDALDNGKRLIIAEFDSKIHQLLTSKIILLFNSSETTSTMLS